MENFTKEQWLALCGDNKRDAGLRAWPFITTAYGEPHRRHHTLAHIATGLRDFDRYFPNTHVDERLAWMFHDVFYLPGCPHNEWMSAQMMRTLCFGLFEDEVVGLAQQHILATREHFDSKLAGSRRVCDIDMLVLSLPWLEYEAYVRDVEAEILALYPSSLWSIGRPRFIEATLARPYIFQTEGLRTWFEHAARRNLEQELSRY